MSLGLTHDTLFCQEEYLYRIIWKFIHVWQGYSLDTTKLSSFVLWTSVCDLDLWVLNIILNPNTLSCLEEHFCQIISKSIHACLSCSPDTAKCLCFWPLTPFVTLTFELWAWFLIVTHCLAKKNIYAKWFKQEAQDRPKSLTW